MTLSARLRLLDVARAQIALVGSKDVRRHSPNLEHWCLQEDKCRRSYSCHSLKENLLLVRNKFEAI